MLAATERLEFQGEQGSGVSSTRRAFQTALTILLARERGGSAAAFERLREVQTLLAAQPWAAAAPIAERSMDIAQAENELARVLYQNELALCETNAVLDARGVKALCDWEFADLTRASNAVGTAQEVADLSIDATKLQAYLQDRFKEPSLTVTECRQQMGGFGKETYLFSVQGQRLAGDFVMRRDHPIELIPGACHRVAKEFHVIKAVRDEGFPSPDALWVDTEHALLPGGDFIVMRRSPGAAGGTLQGAGAAPSPALNDQLGTVMGRLHSLPPLTRLGTLNESIRPELWTESSAEVLRIYLREFRSMLLTQAHAPSLATVALFNWLLANVPETGARPCLIHGDIGFHNMLLENGEMTALLDWESSQIGHPGQDLAYVYNAGHASLDWPRVMRAYQAAGGTPLSDRELLYFRIMMLGRLLVTLNIGPARLFTGEVDSVKLLNAEMVFRPPVFRQVAELLERYESLYGAGGQGA
ncbi:phosphotransferase family protein [Steroidobacter sp.]|uniref:phosphotransferase family protein n=1 Tax=Steroidobacter sp. TaxID=1978227 RepID=UPI001A56D0AA|nr:phosphotransferase family protein [Steroidobacter sp.]MBL8267680.1 phosphotransferase family protein [Steroidobacter sp.]